MQLNERAKTKRHLRCCPSNNPWGCASISTQVCLENIRINFSPGFVWNFLQMHSNCVFQNIWIICISTSVMHWLLDIMIKREGYAQYRSLYGDQSTSLPLAWRRAWHNLLLTEISIANCALFITWFSTASEHYCPWYSVASVGHFSSASPVPWSTLPRDASLPTESYNARRTPQKQGSGSALLYKISHGQ